MENNQKEIVIDLTTAVKAAISKKNGEVQDKVVEHFANIELEKRTAAVIQAFEMHQSAKKELEKIRPDVKTFDNSGKSNDPVYSENQYNKLNSAKEKLRKINEALEAAFSENQDYNKLFQRELYIFLTTIYVNVLM